MADSWRSTVGQTGPFNAIATIASASYSDVAVTSKATYWYRVTSFDGAENESQPSNVVNARRK